MEQHPVPQHISSYQFRLVGDMTLKQFFQLAGGVLVSLLFYSSPLHPLIKWPLVIFFAILGVALAFLPFQERPLEHWIAAFFKSIYSPTIYIWKREPYISYFEEEATGSKPQEVGKKVFPSVPTIPTVSKVAFLPKLEEAENSFLSRLSGLFIKPKEPVPETPKAFETQIAPPPAPIKIPAIQSAGFPKTNVPFEPAKVGVGPTLPLSGITRQRPQAGREAQFSLSAAPPSPPSSPNLVVGQVVSSEGKIIENAIIEIRDAQGHPVRALKSNKVGHFMIVTPLANGRYQMIIEKEGYDFEPVFFDAGGNIIPPIAIYAKRGVL